MSDESTENEVTPIYGPSLTAEQLVERVERIRRDADEAANARLRSDTDEIQHSFARMAERMIARFSVLPCGGESERISACTSGFEKSCPEANSPSCPKRSREAEQAVLAFERNGMLARSGMPEEARQVVIAAMKPTKAKIAVDQFFDEDKRILVLAGGAGTGKTTAACYALLRGGGLFVCCGEFARLGGYDQNSRERMRQLAGCGLLVFDDLGTEFLDAKGFFTAALDSLLVERYGANRKTIITTNLNGPAFKERYGERIADRVRGDGAFVVVGNRSMRGSAEGGV